MYTNHSDFFANRVKYFCNKLPNQNRIEIVQKNLRLNWMNLGINIRKRN